MCEKVEMLLEEATRARREQRFVEAKRDAEDALKICRTAGTQRDLARTLKTLGRIERDLDRPDIALHLYEEAAAIYRKEDDALLLAHTVRHIADVQREIGRQDVAESNYREALAIYRSHPEASRLDFANAVRGLAILTSETGRNDEAKLLWQEAKELYVALNVEAGIRESTRRLDLLASS